MPTELVLSFNVLKNMINTATVSMSECTNYVAVTSNALQLLLAFPVSDRLCLFKDYVTVKGRCKKMFKNTNFLLRNMS